MDDLSFNVNISVDIDSLYDGTYQQAAFLAIAKVIKNMSLVVG
jgi:hypothetical protein